MAICEKCGGKTGFLQPICIDCQEKERRAFIAEVEEQEVRKRHFEAKIAEVMLSTGDIRTDYEIADVIFVMAAHKAGFFEPGANPDEAFAVLRRSLKERAVHIGAHAVIHCQFEYRAAVSQVVHKQVFELFAYGTAVRLKSKEA